MKLAKFTLAAAIATAFAAPAGAGTLEGTSYVILANATAIANLVAVYGEVAVAGAINVEAEAGAVLDNEQTSTVSVTPGEEVVGPEEDPNTAYLSGGSGNDATGNIGINVASGTGNGQSNTAALAAVDAEYVFASAQTFSDQVNSGVVTTAPGTYDTAFIEESLVGASGNVGVNVAAGDSNLQANQTAAAVSSTGTIAKATGTSIQTLNGTYVIGLGQTNLAYLSAGSLSGAVGNIGVNVVAGVGNAQHNSLSLAVASPNSFGIGGGQ